MEFKSINPNSQVLIISHADLDGISAALLAKQKISNQPCSIWCHMSPVAGMTNKILDLLTSEVDVYAIKQIYILDRASNNETIEKVNSNYPNAVLNIIDHHISQQDFYNSLNESHRFVNLYIDYQVSATQIIQRLLPDNKFETFARLVDLWDTFKWKDCQSQHVSQLARSLNSYLYMLGSTTAYNTFQKNIEILENGDIINLPGFQLLSDAYNNRLELEVNRIKDRMILLDYQEKYSTRLDYSLDNLKRSCLIGYVPYEVDPGLISMAFNMILDDETLGQNTPSLIFVMSNDGVLSARSAKESPISALEFIRLIDPTGGGHPQAAGGNISIPFAHRDLLTEVLFNSRNLLSQQDIQILECNHTENKLIRSDIKTALEKFLSKTDITIEEK